MHTARDMVRNNSNQAMLSLATKDKSKIIVDLTPLEMQASGEHEALTSRRNNNGQSARMQGQVNPRDHNHSSHKKLAELKGGL